MLINECVCNFCGKICEHEEYKIPMFNVETTYATNSKGVKLFPFRDEKLITKNVDLCDDCKIKVARLMELVKFIDLNNHEICLVEKKNSKESEEKYHQITMDEYLESLQTDGE